MIPPHPPQRLGKRSERGFATTKGGKYGCALSRVRSKGKMRIWRMWGGGEILYALNTESKENVGTEGGTFADGCLRKMKGSGGIRDLR